MTHLETAREVVDALGGIPVVSGLTGSAPKSVSAWQSQDESFPPKTYVVMTAALSALGATAPPSLWRQVERPAVTEPSTVPHDLRCAPAAA